MSFKNFVCWRPAWVGQVMDTEALQPPDHVFLATHHPVKMQRTTLTSLYSGGSPEGSGAGVYAEGDLLRDFLAPKDFAFVPVLGDAGTGKSHLIRWLWANIPPAPNRHVLLIPKIDTNLRDVLDRILRLPGTEGAHFEEYRSRLRRAASEVHSEGQAREKLLNNLAVSCGVNGPYQMQDLSQMQSYLVQNLPGLLYDMTFRKALLRDGGVIHRLVEHTLGNTSAVERLDEGRGFKLEDLPLRVTDSIHAGAGAKRFYGQLIGQPTLQPETVTWLNANLDAAISELLELRGETLLRLMLEVREALAARGIELVLLIEDFAKLQGIDKQLLEAVIAKPRQEGHGPLCPLRTALACTTGYFRNLLQTVQTRVDFCVTLDVQGSDGGSAGMMTADDVEQFTARYLNAARLREVQLKEWHEAVVDSSDDERPELPNACEECPYRDPCHESFGSKEGFGLYPFTRTALGRMSERASPQRFNPRLLLKDVLKHVLVAYADDLERGQFPPPPLLDHFKGPKVLPTVTDAVSRRDPNPLSQRRRLALLDLWTDGTRLVDLPPTIHEAFSLPPLGAGADAAQTVGPTAPASDDLRPPAPRAEVQVGLPKGAQDKLRLLQEWHTGALMPQALVNELRPLIFDAVQARVDWDSLILVRGHFSGREGTKPFRQRSINFERQAIQRAQSAVALQIPLAGESITDATIALQALLLFDHFGHWKFSYQDQPGSYYLRKYSAQLELWSRRVTEQIYRPCASGAEWDPAPAAAELLAVGARMANRPPATKATAIDEQLSALFVTLEPIQIDHRSQAWRELFRAVRDQQDMLSKALLARVGCTKGGHSRVQVIDAARLTETLKSLRKDWTPKEDVPSDVWDSLGKIARVREKVMGLLPQAISEERDRHVAWLDSVLEAIDPSIPRAEIVAAVRHASQAASDEGVHAGVSRERLEEATEKFSRGRLDLCLEAIARMRVADESGPLFLELGRDYDEVMRATDEFLSLVRSFGSATHARTAEEIENLAGVGEQREAQQSISENIDQLYAAMSELAGGGA